MVRLRAERRYDGNTSTTDAVVDWRSSAACAREGLDPELFFPVSRHGPTEPAKAVCRACPAVRDCLRYAIANDVQGVWGGTTYDERNYLREQYGITAEPVTTPLFAEVDRLHQVTRLNRRSQHDRIA